LVVGGSEGQQAAGAAILTLAALNDTVHVLRLIVPRCHWPLLLTGAGSLQLATVEVWDTSSPDVAAASQLWTQQGRQGAAAGARRSHRRNSSSSSSSSSSSDDDDDSSDLEDSMGGGGGVSEGHLGGHTDRSSGRDSGGTSSSDGRWLGQRLVSAHPAPAAHQHGFPTQCTQAPTHPHCMHCPHCRLQHAVFTVRLVLQMDMSSSNPYHCIRPRPLSA
jgi:hypothetical protein